jgi:hypothetical protein
MPISIFEPLNRQRLKGRIQNNFSSAYLTLISIIQGVAFGILLNNTFSILREKPDSKSIILLYSFISLVSIVLVFSYYSWFISVVYTLPNFREAAIPFSLATTQILPMFFLSQPRLWWLLFGIFTFVGAAAFCNTLISLHQGSFTEDFQAGYRKTRWEVGSNVFLAFIISVISGAAWFFYPVSPDSSKGLGIKDLIPLVITFLVFIIMIAKSQFHYLDSMFEEAAQLNEPQSLEANRISPTGDTQMSDKDTTDTSMLKFEEWLQDGVTKAARKVFNHLDERLEPRLFLVGILVTEETETIRLVPAQESGYKPEFFSGVMKLAHQIEEKEAERAPGGRSAAQGAQALKVSDKSIQSALLQILKKSDEATGTDSYCSLPTTVGGYQVCCVLQLDAKVSQSYFSLPEDRMQSWRFARSLIDSTVVEFLKVCARVLRDPIAGLEPDTLGREPEEILRMGGKELMFRAANSGGGPNPKAFEALNALSWKTHERELAGGEMLIVIWDHPNLDMQVEFKPPVDLNELGAARKIIEMAKAKKLIEKDEERLYLVSSGDSLYAIGRMNEPKDDSERYYSDIFTVRFTGYYRWELRHKEGGVMMKVINGVPSLSRNPIPIDKFKDIITRKFLTSSPDADELLRIVQEAAAQKKGTMIVISSAAEAEAERLGNQSTLIKPVRHSKERLLMLTSIDGALLVDPAGMYQAAGVILDGIAVKGKGSRARGARYNSGITYLHYAEEKKHECLVVIISEDGTVNLVPDLRKRIYRSDITEHMDKLRAAVESESVKTKEYYKALNWLGAHRFYLSESLSLEINKIKDSTKPRLEKQEGYSMTPTDFKADDEMNDSYFLDEPGDAEES